MEIKKEVKTYQVTFECPECKTGELIANYVLTTNPPRYVHNCNNCDYTDTFENAYPYMEYK